MGSSAERRFGAVDYGVLAPQNEDVITTAKARSTFIQTYLDQERNGKRYLVYTVHPVADPAELPDPLPAGNFLRNVAESSFLFRPLVIHMNPQGELVASLPDQPPARLYDVMSRIREQGAYLIIMKKPPMEDKHIRKPAPSYKDIRSFLICSPSLQTALVAQLRPSERNALKRFSLDAEGRLQVVHPDDLARSLGISETNLMQYQCAARRKLRKLMEGIDPHAAYATVASVIPETIHRFLALPLAKQQEIYSSLPASWQKVLVARYNLDHASGDIPFVRKPRDVAKTLTEYTSGQIKYYSHNMLKRIRKLMERVR